MRRRLYSLKQQLNFKLKHIYNISAPLLGQHYMRLKPLFAPDGGAGSDLLARVNQKQASSLQEFIQNAKKRSV